MARRDDVRVNFASSPRVARFAAPTTQMSVQDLHDTLVDIEEEPNALSYDSLVSTAGGEPLGGGVTVGLTMALNNTVVAFDARKASAATGTITTADASSLRLIDSNATFITDGVEPGAWVINTSDWSVCSVFTVDSETQLTTDLLGDGTDDEWEIGDGYKIWNVIQVELAGGNVTAKDENGVDISPLLPTMGTQALVARSSTATLQELQDIQFASFSGGVTLDEINGVAGIEYPIGTPRSPSNNLDDVMIIATERGFGTIFVVGDATVDNNGDYIGMVFIGESKSKTTLNISEGANVFRAEFYDAHITGTLDGEAVVRDCVVDDLDYISGYIEQCILNPGTITLGGNTEAHFLDCWSGVPGTGTPIIDLGGSGQALALRNYNGGIELQNKSGSEAVSIDLNSGQVVLDSTITNGDIVIRGIGKLTNNSVGANVLADDLLNKEGIGDAVWSAASGLHLLSEIDVAVAILKNKTVTNPITGIMTVYDTDDATPLFTAQIYENVAGSQQYRGQGIERRDQLT